MGVENDTLYRIGSSESLETGRANPARLAGSPAQTPGGPTNCSFVDRWDGGVAAEARDLLSSGMHLASSVAWEVSPPSMGPVNEESAL
jgi:hypothetical protein